MDSINIQRSGGVEVKKGRDTDHLGGTGKS